MPSSMRLPDPSHSSSRSAGGASADDVPAGTANAELRASVARVRLASAGFLDVLPDAELPLGEFHADELRASAVRMLALLDRTDATRDVGVELDVARRVERAVRALASLDLRAVCGGDRQALAEAVARIHDSLTARGDPEVTRALLDATPVGAALASLVFDLDPGLLDPDCQVSYCQAAQRLESATHARLAAGLVAFAGNNPRNTAYSVDGDAFEITDVRASELASALSWSGGRARGAVESARRMSNELDAAAAAAAAGALQPAALTAITDGARMLTATIDDAIAQAREALAADTDSTPEISDRLWELTSAREDLVQRYDSTVSAFASTHTLAETKRKVRDTLARLDPEGFQARRERARETQSGVELRGLPDAMAMITAVMPAEHATACFRSIDVLARDARCSDPELPIGVRRSDALLALCSGTAFGAASATPSSGAAVAAVPAWAAGAGDGPGGTGGNGTPATGVVAASGDASAAGHGVRGRGTSAHVDLVMTLDAFLGLADTPAECVGAGPIPAQSARDLLSAATVVSFRRVLVDPTTGHALDVGVRRYQLTDAERAYIFARDRVCRRPGCHQPARVCDTDHAIPWDEGGASRTDNLGALCTRHHQEKTHGGWRIEDSRADGSCTFVSPLGRRYEHPAEPLLPWAEFTPGPDEIEPS